MRGFIPVLLLIAGLLFLATAAVEYALARDAQQEAQSILERRWVEEQRQAAKKRLLPGERPLAPLDGLGKVWALAAAGGSLTIAAILFWGWQLSRRKPA
jgi:hypothetical protein